MPQTNQYPVQTAPSVIPLEHVTYLTATFVLLETSVLFLIAVSGDTSVQMALFVLLEEPRQQFVYQVITAKKPKLKCRVQLVFTVQMVLHHISLVLQGTTVTRQIVVILLT